MPSVGTIAQLADAADDSIDLPDTAAAPPYAQMALEFWNAFQITNNLHSACLKAQEVILARPEALSLLNRYGSRSPTYTATDLCPF